MFGCAWLSRTGQAIHHRLPVHRSAAGRLARCLQDAVVEAIYCDVGCSEAW